MNKTNPHGKYIADEASGVDVLNEKWVAWEEGYCQCMAEAIKQGDYTGDGWIVFIKEE